ncbi:MAG: hypothetical protein K0R12_1109 [Gammaproteobacteria bacterium]|nr:hypothetical protein [Gammaproteobacteria bacterium]
MTVKPLRSPGVSIVEFILVLVAIGFITLSGIHFISVKIEQNKVRKAADQIQAWLLAAQSYYRDKVKDPDFAPPSNGDYWPHALPEMYPYIADSTISSMLSLNDNSTKDPWGNQYIVPLTSDQHPYEIPTTITADSTYIGPFILQAQIDGLERALAVAAQLPAAQLARDPTTGEIISTKVSNKNRYYLNAVIPIPPLVGNTAVGHQLVQNIGVVVTKQNNSYNGYNYTIDQLNSDGSIKAEQGSIHTNDDTALKSYGAVFIRKPDCEKRLTPYLQASVAGFGIMGGYTTQYNHSHYYGLPVNGDGSSSFGAGLLPYTLFSTSPVPLEKGNTATVSNTYKPDDNTFFPDFQMDLTKDNIDAADPFSTGGSLTSRYKLLGAVIGAHVKATELQPSMENPSIEGWYVWLDITANMMMYPNYDADNLPQAIQDCAMDVNTRDTEHFPYGKSYNNRDYDYIPSSPNLDSTGKCTDSNGNCAMYPADLILRGTAPLYAPSPCHFHSGYIAYITSCAPAALANANGLDQAMMTLQN